MNEYTISVAEDFIDVMKMYTNAVFVGNHTAGLDGQPLCEDLESGGSLRICTRRCIAQNGEDITKCRFFENGWYEKISVALSEWENKSLI